MGLLRKRLDISPSMEKKLKDCKKDVERKIKRGELPKVNPRTGKPTSAFGICICSLGIGKCPVHRR